jgi:hypothetical protein
MLLYFKFGYMERILYLGFDTGEFAQGAHHVRPDTPWFRQAHVGPMMLGSAMLKTAPPRAGLRFGS